MMKNTIVVYLFFTLFSQSAFSQVKIIVLDTFNKNPIQDVYLIDQGKAINNILTYSDNLGQIQVNQKNDNGILTLVHISYYLKQISINNSTNGSGDTIYLVPKSYTLGSVTVQNLRTNQSKVFGYYKQGKRQNLFAPATNSLYGTIIKVDPFIKKYKIESLFCHFVKLNMVESKKSECKAGIIFHFLRYSSGIPTLESIADPIIIDYKELKENFKIDIPYSPIIENITGGVMVGIELQNLQCIGETQSHKQYYLVNQESDTNLNWTYVPGLNKWFQYDNSLFSGKLGISLKIGYYEK